MVWRAAAAAALRLARALVFVFCIEVMGCGFIDCDAADGEARHGNKAGGDAAAAAPAKEEGPALMFRDLDRPPLLRYRYCHSRSPPSFVSMYIYTLPTIVPGARALFPPSQEPPRQAHGRARAAAAAASGK